VKILRRVGTSPRERGSLTGETCPDILQLDTGDYLIIGMFASPWAHAEAALAEHGASIGDDEAAVVVPAEVMRAAALEIAGRIAITDAAYGEDPT
jgi:hypothetical protein